MELDGSNQLLGSVVIKYISFLGGIGILVLFLRVVSVLVLDPVGLRVVTDAPAAQSFVGSWELVESSFESVKTRTGNKKCNPLFTLLPNGRFVAEDIPIEDNFESPRWRLQSGEGQWEVAEQQSWVLKLMFDGGFGVPWGMYTGSGDRFLFAYSIGDPDSNERWIFRKRDRE